MSSYTDLLKIILFSRQRTIFKAILIVQPVSVLEILSHFSEHSPLLIANHPEKENWYNFIFVFFSVWGKFGQELFFKECHALVVKRIKWENWDETNFKVGVGTTYSEYIEWTV